MTKELKFANQVWMKENLCTFEFKNGTPLFFAKNSDQWYNAALNKIPACCFYDFDENNKDKYGLLYNWYAISDPQGLAPEGWRIPSVNDWKALAKTLYNMHGGSKDSFLYGEDYYLQTSALLLQRTDENDFAARRGGRCSNYGDFSEISELAYYWCAHEEDKDYPDSVWLLYLYYEYDHISISQYEWKDFGLSVRCVKDAPVEEIVFQDNADKEYQEVKIDKLLWMTENLSVSRFRNGDEIPEAKTFEEYESAGNRRQPAWCYYDFDSANGEKFGKMYNWFAVNDHRGLAPKGWIIPEEKHWLSFIRHIGIKSAATKLLEKNDEYGFKAKLGGYGNHSSFSGKNHPAYGDFATGWWTSTEMSNLNAFAMMIFSESETVQKHYWDERACLYIRCIKDTLEVKEEEVFSYKPEPFIIEKRKEYSNIKIGDTIWMNENLSQSYFRNGDVIKYAPSRQEWLEACENEEPAWCFYENDPENEKEFGKLYNWYAVNDERGLAPEKWRIINSEDINNLLKLFGGQEASGYKTKSLSENESVRNMKMIPAGYRDDTGHYAGQPYAGFWWVKFVKNEYDNSISQNIAYSEDTLNCGASIESENKAFAFAVRCVMGTEEHLKGIFTFELKDSNSPEVKIGNTIWMSKNLNVSAFRNGDIIKEAKTEEEWIAAAENEEPAWCYYENSHKNGQIYGKLYNAYAVFDKRGLAPKDWEIADENHWLQLIEYLGGGSVACEKLRSETGWLGAEGNNLSGFNALPGGYRMDGVFYGRYSDVWYWTRSEEEEEEELYPIAFNIGLDCTKECFYTREYGLAVRCVKTKKL